MPSLKILFVRFYFVCLCEFLKLVAFTIGLASLPNRLYRRIVKASPKSEIPFPKAEIIVHEPNSSYATPRDSVLLVHGFPDSPALWDDTVACLTNEGYRCLVAALPGSRGEPVPRAPTNVEVAESIATALGEVSQGSITVVAHDWGSFFSQILNTKRPELFHRIVLLDVGQMSQKSDMHWTAWVCVLSYQSLFALMFVIGAPCRWLLLKFVGGLWQYQARPVKEITVDMTYPYYSTISSLFWLFAGTSNALTQDTINSSVPQLYVYGKKKPFMFHDSHFLERVRASPCGKVVGMPCGHWITCDMAGEWKTLLTTWLEESEQASNPLK